ncbi:probable E3 ubiquitin-protein ligase HECTD4 isoform X4 [Danio rerio]|uniref:Probable E3 ubiquitin-protein ligase HECTD4 isoform X4 n=1 Tax=Danio rerio TaxID=7955 RepID=A0AC58ID31_DANRE
MVYGFSHKVQRNGQLNLMGAVCFPLDASPSNTGLTSPPTANQYPSIIIPTDKVHNKLGVSPPPGAMLVLHSLLLEFPLAMAFAEQLLTYSVGETIKRSEDELDTVPTSVLIQVVELLVPEEKFLTLEVFHKFTLDRAKQDIRSVWRAILACVYDLLFDRFAGFKMIFGFTTSALTSHISQKNRQHKYIQYHHINHIKNSIIHEILMAVGTKDI